MQVQQQQQPKNQTARNFSLPSDFISIYIRSVFFFQFSFSLPFFLGEKRKFFAFYLLFHEFREKKIETFDFCQIVRYFIFSFAERQKKIGNV